MFKPIVCAIFALPFFGFACIEPSLVPPTPPEPRCQIVARCDDPKPIRGKRERHD